MATGLSGTLAAGERVAVLGPPGVAKTTLFRALAGIWPFGHGCIRIPARARTLFLAHQPYLPMGTLREAIAYPANPSAFPDGSIREVLSLVGLDSLAPRLEERESWDQALSGDEQQRLVFARALLHAPDWLIMDDATAALDEGAEKRVYEALAARLPATTVVSITNRPNVAQSHPRRFALALGADGAASLRPA
ncbi:MAG: ATP-binding cassette domain-containing protein [Thermodesulfobacteriota bacterium]